MKNTLGLVLGLVALAGCEPDPTVLSVAPNLLCSGIDSTVTVTGEDFRETPSVTLTHAGGQRFNIVEPDVAWRSGEQLTFTTRPSLGLAPGGYDVTVKNPSGNEGTLKMALTVVPPPVLVSISPAALCDTTATTLTLTGMLFHHEPALGPMKVIIGTPTPTVLTEGNGAVVFVNEQTVTAAIPAGLPAGTWSVTIVDSDGCTSTLAAALPIYAPPTISSISPAAPWNGQDTTITIAGTGFRASPSLSIALAGQPPVALTNATLVDAQTLTAVVPMGTPPGDYTLTVAYADGCSATFALTVSAMTPITVTDAIVPFGCSARATPLTIGGMFFQSTPQATLLGAGVTAGSDLALKNVAFVSATKLTGVVPSGGKIGGPYDLKVTNPDGGAATKTMAFTVTKLCPPLIDEVSPSSVPQDYNTMAAGSSAIIIKGANFRSDAQVVLVNKAGMESQFPAAALTITPTQITLNFNAGTTALTGGLYLIRVKEADDAVANGGTGSTMWGDYSLFIVTNPSGKFQTAVAAKALPTGRRGHGVVGGQNNAAARYLYALAGDGGGATPTLLADGVFAQLDVFGAIGDVGWQRLRKRAATPATGDTFNDLPSARTSVAAAQHNRWVYVVGGTTSVASGAAPQATAPLNEVVRAHILSSDDAPQAGLSSTAGGTLPAGTYYYKVSMLVAAGTPGYGAAIAETVASDEQVAVLSAGQAVQLDFSRPSTSSVPGGNVVGYRVYRSIAANASSQSEVWLADVATMSTSSSFIDTGSATPGGAHPLPAGMLSAWELAGTLLIPRAGASVALATPPGGTTPNLYVLGGLSNPTGPVIERTYELATINATDGTLTTFGPTGLTAGGATNCTAIEQCMTTGRVSLFSSTVTGPPSVTSDVYLIAGAGATAGGAAVQERARVLTGGLLGPFAAIPTSGGGAFTTMAATFGPIGIYSSGHIAIINGYSGTTVSNKDEFGNEACSAALVSGACPTGTDFTQTQKSSSTLGLSPSVAFSGYALTSGYLFVVGGSTDGTNAVTNVSQGAQ